MHDVLNKARELHERLTEYHTDVDVEIYPKKKTLSAEADKVSVPFNIDLEFRSWGLKDISVMLYDEITVPYLLVDMEADREEERELVVDLSKLNIDYYEGGGYYPEVLVIHLNEDGTVNYADSYMHVSYLKK